MPAIGEDILEEMMAENFLEMINNTNKTNPQF